MRVRTSIISVGLFGLIFGSVVDSEAASTRIKIPMECSQGPKRQFHKGAITVPPAVAQGAVGIEVRNNDRETQELLATIHCYKTELRVTTDW